MRLKIPMTGTVIGFDPACYKLDSVGISGDNNDPVRPVGINLGGISWRLVSIDLETDLMEVEAEAPEKVDVPVLDAEGKPVLEGGEPRFINVDGVDTPIFDAQGKPLLRDRTPKITTRATTSAEKGQILANAKHILESKTTDEIYTLTKDKRLIKPTSVMEKYRAVNKVV